MFMKRLILLSCLAALVLLAIPASGLAAKAGEFDLGGYIKLETFWDSTQMGKNLNTPALRRNAAQPNNIGRLRLTAQSTRFNFTIRGPEVWGAKTTGYIEVDFDAVGDARQTSSNSFTPRLRHAWFRMDWPGGWSLLMGQYWGVFCNFYPEVIQDGPYQNHGQATQRIPQIRLTYTTGPWKFSGLVGVNYDPAGDNVTQAYGPLIGSQAASVNTGAALWGQNATFPQFQGEVTYEKDLWGKAGFGGRPRGFVANVGAAITRINYQGGRIIDPTTGFALTWGDNNYQAVGGIPLVNESQTLVPWVVQATLFIPVLATKTENLRGTMSVTVQFYIGQGLSFIGNGRDADNSWFKYSNPGWINGTQVLFYDRHLTRQYGGYIQGQYYFNNQWYVSYVYGFAKPYGVTQSRNQAIPLFDALNPAGYEYATLTDQTRMWQEHCATLFYTPIKALKFGLGYSYVRTDWFQITTVGSRQTRVGENHSIRFGGWFFF